MSHKNLRRGDTRTRVFTNTVLASGEEDKNVEKESWYQKIYNSLTNQSITKLKCNIKINCDVDKKFTRNDHKKSSDVTVIVLYVMITYF